MAPPPPLLLPSAVVFGGGAVEAVDAESLVVAGEETSAVQA